jgi:hypothetical protein
MHVHIAAPFHSPDERARARAYVAGLKERGPRHAFGFADIAKRFEGEAGGASAAIYLGKYIGKDVGTELPVRHPVFIAPFLTQETGVTMRNLRWRRHIWHRLGFRPGADELRPLIALLQAFPSLENVGTTNQPSGP